MNVRQAKSWTISFVFICVTFQFSFLLFKWCQSWYPINYFLPPSLSPPHHTVNFMHMYKLFFQNLTFFKSFTKTHFSWNTRSFLMIIFYLPRSVNTCTWLAWVTIWSDFDNHSLCFCHILYLSNSRLQELQIRCFVPLPISLQN